MHSQVFLSILHASCSLAELTIFYHTIVHCCLRYCWQGNILVPYQTYADSTQLAS